MGLPNINIVFKTLAQNVVKNTNGTVALILQDTVPKINPIVMQTDDDIPDTLTEENQNEIQRAFIGNTKHTDKVIAYIIPVQSISENTPNVDYTTAQTYLETILWDYIAVPQIAAGDVISFAKWIKDCRDSKKLRVKAVLPHCVADHEGIIDFETDDIKVGSNTYTASQYCGRIAGLLAGTTLDMSATYAVLSEIDDVPHYVQKDFDTSIDAGKFVLMNDGEKVKVARAVTSLTTLTDSKGKDFQKIKIVAIMDKINDDIKRTTADNYIGKVPNVYDDKCLLITAINGYFETLEKQRLLLKGENSVNIDMDAQKFLQDNKIDTSSMKEQDIKEANTGTNVFLTGNVKILDAMEDIALDLFM